MKSSRGGDTRFDGSRDSRYRRTDQKGDMEVGTSDKSYISTGHSEDFTFSLLWREEIWDSRKGKWFLRKCYRRFLEVLDQGRFERLE